MEAATTIGGEIEIWEREGGYSQKEPEVYRNGGRVPRSGFMSEQESSIRYTTHYLHCKTVSASAADVTLPGSPLSLLLTEVQRISKLFNVFC